MSMMHCGFTALLCCAAAFSPVWAQNQTAQGVQNAQPAAAGTSGAADQQASPADSLQEVVVTANRRAENVQNVPMTVTPVTAETIQNTGIKTANDLQMILPSVQISQPGGAGNPNIVIRGINSTVGAPTVGIYLDDVPLQERNAGSAATIFPQLYDLERVETLEGPQGTLYGGSSEGGTIRFITPAPSFTTTTLDTHVEGSATQGGDPNAEVAVAYGGPIIDNVLAAHASVWYRHEGGYIDHISQFTGDVLAGGDNTNSADLGAYHAALTWKAADGLLVTASYFYVRNFYRDSNQYDTTIPQYSAYAGPGVPGTLYTYCPCYSGVFDSLNNTNIGKDYYTSDSQIHPLLSPTDASMSLPSLIIDYQLQGVDLRSITAYNLTIDDSAQNYANVDIDSRALTPLEEPYNSYPFNGPYLADLPNYTDEFTHHSNTSNFTEELRATSSNPPDARITWVGGLFYEDTTQASNSIADGNTGDLEAAILDGLPSAAGTAYERLNGIGLVEPETLSENQEAAYGQANLRIIQPLHLLAGLRITRDSFSYHSEEGGALFGYAPGVVETVAQGTITQAPVTPLYGLQYVVNPDLNVYATAAKGFRPGGVNAAVSPTCTPADLAAAGLTSAKEAATYRSDSLWSYELGSKAITWNDRASLDGSIYEIIWPGVQTSIYLTCSSGVIYNAAKAVSKGASLQSQFLLFRGFTLNANGAYTDSRYVGGVGNTLDGVTTLLIRSGQEMPDVPLWSGTASVNYSFTLGQRPVFVRYDYDYQGAVVTSSSGPGALNYTPESYYLGGHSLSDLRIGMTLGKYQLQAFVTNLFNSQQALSHGDFSEGPGPVGCKNASCTAYQEYSVGNVYSTFPPRIMGVDFDYKY